MLGFYDFFHTVIGGLVNFLFLQILSAKVLTTNYTLNSAKLIVLRENFKTLQDINTTPKEPKTERGCSSTFVAVDS